MKELTELVTCPGSDGAPGDGGNNTDLGHRSPHTEAAPPEGSTRTCALCIQDNYGVLGRG